MAFNGHPIDVKQEVRGKWRGVLLQLGLPDSALQNKHGPCPLCGEGEDRYRFDNREGTGSYICGQCGAGDGWTLLKGFKGWNFAQAADAVREVLNIKPLVRDQIEPLETEEQKKAKAAALWREGKPIRSGDPADLYLISRGLGDLVYSHALRAIPRCRYDGDTWAPAMLAAVQDVHGKGCAVHRTFLTPEGRKAEVPSPRKVLGVLPAGAAVRLQPAGPVLGVAEGVETALAAERIFGIPVWAALNAVALAAWVPPAGTEEVFVFGDNDLNFTGHKAAYALANRLALDGMIVRVRIPDEPGTDWADRIPK